MSRSSIRRIWAQRYAYTAFRTRAITHSNPAEHALIYSNAANRLDLGIRSISSSAIIYKEDKPGGADETGKANDKGEAPPAPEELGTEDDGLVEPFDLSSFDDFKEEEIIEKVENMDSSVLTPVMAKEIVAKMVELGKAKVAGPDSSLLLSKLSITHHMLQVLRASRIQTNVIEEVLNHIESKRHPFEKMVVGEIYFNELGLSKYSKAALLKICEGRLRIKLDRRDRKRVKIMKSGEEDHPLACVRYTCKQYPSKVENKLQVIWMMETLVRIAKESVGETVDNTLVENLDEAVQYILSEEYPMDQSDKLVTAQYLKAEAVGLERDFAKLRRPKKAPVLLLSMRESDADLKKRVETLKDSLDREALEQITPS